MNGGTLGGGARERIARNRVLLASRQGQAMGSALMCLSEIKVPRRRRGWSRRLGAAWGKKNASRKEQSGGALRSDEKKSLLTGELDTKRASRNVCKRPACILKLKRGGRGK